MTGRSHIPLSYAKISPGQLTVQVKNLEYYSSLYKVAVTPITFPWEVNWQWWDWVIFVATSVNPFTAHGNPQNNPLPQTHTGHVRTLCCLHTEKLTQASKTVVTVISGIPVWAPLSTHQETGHFEGKSDLECLSFLPLTCNGKARVRVFLLTGARGMVESFIQQGGGLLPMFLSDRSGMIHS